MHNPLNLGMGLSGHTCLVGHLAWVVCVSTPYVRVGWGYAVRYRQLHTHAHRVVVVVVVDVANRIVLRLLRLLHVLLHYRICH